AGRDQHDVPLAPSAVELARRLRGVEAIEAVRERAARLADMPCRRCVARAESRERDRGRRGLASAYRLCRAGERVAERLVAELVARAEAYDEHALRGRAGQVVQKQCRSGLRLQVAAFQERGKPAF